MTALGVIPARKGSHRFPDKQHAALLGKPMFGYTVEAALQARKLDRVVISSDDEALIPMANRYGIEFIHRPADLATDSAPLDDAIRHVCRLLDERDRFQPDVILTMQSNVPIRRRGQIDEVVARLERLEHATAVCTAQHLRFRPEWAKVITDDQTGECAPYIEVDRGFRTQDYAPIYAMDGAIYGVRRTTLLASAGNRATHSWFGSRLHLLVQDDAMYSLEVDYPDQIALAEFYLARIVAHDKSTSPL